MKPMPTFMIILFITLFIFLSKRSDPPASCFALAGGLCTETPCVFGADTVASILPSLDPFVVESTYIYCDSSPKAHYSANVRDDNNIYDTVNVVLFSSAQRAVAVPRTVAVALPFDPSGVKPALYQRPSAPELLPFQLAKMLDSSELLPALYQRCAEPELQPSQHANLSPISDGNMPLDDMNKPPMCPSFNMLSLVRDANVRRVNIAKDDMIFIYFSSFTSLLSMATALFYFNYGLLIVYRSLLKVMDSKWMILGFQRPLFVFCNFGSHNVCHV